MSVDVNTVPPWKQVLLERKRSLDPDERPGSNKEVENISSLPTWKQDILRKKQQTKNSVIFLGDTTPPKSTYSNILREKPPQCEDGRDVKILVNSNGNELLGSKENASNGDGEEEHLPTLCQNPWLKADVRYTRKKSPNNRHSDPVTHSHVNHVTKQHSWHETDVVVETNENSESIDEVFRGEEVTYGKGFVHKLLKRFSHMSDPEEKERVKIKRPTSERLSRSSDDLLNDKSQTFLRPVSPSDHYVESYSPRSPTRSRSTDSLPSPRSYSVELEDTKRTNKMGYGDKAGLASLEVISQENNNDYQADITVSDTGSNNVSIVNESLNNSSEEVEDLPKRNTVSSARTVFENIAHVSAQPKLKLDIISPRGHSSKSVHSLIAVDTLSNDHLSTFETSVSPPVTNNALDAPLGFHPTSPASIHHVDGPSSGFAGHLVTDKPNSPTDSGSSRFVGYSVLDKLPVKDGNSTEITVSAKPITQVDGATTAYAGYSITSKPSVPKKSPELYDKNKSRSKYFVGAPSKSENKTVKNIATKSRTTNSISPEIKPAKNSNDMKDIVEKDNSINTSKKVVNVSVNDSHSGLNFLSQSTGLNTSSTSNSMPSDDSVVNGHVYNSVSDKISAVEKLYPNSLKKRKAPSPPNQNKNQSESDNKKHVTSVLLSDSETEIKSSKASNSFEATANGSSSNLLNSEQKHVSKVEVNSSSGLNGNINNSDSDFNQNKRKSNETIANKKAEANRQNLSLNLNDITSKKVESNKVVSSKIVKENPLSVINSKNKKAKFKVPKAGGPGSLLIRPASNMVQGKNPQFVALEFNYKDIKKGDFAPAKKLPAYYEEYSDSDESVEDIPVTNIDDVIETANEKDANANVPKKTKSKKYDFVGQMVVLEKSSIRSRNIKSNIQFNDHSTSTYEYPSQQSLLDSMPPEVGDFDHPDTVFNTILTPSDEEIPDMDEPTQKLKSTPGIGSESSLAGYQTKMQVEFHLGMNPMESDIPIQQRNGQVKSEQVQEDPSSLVKPADEEDTFQWSENKTSDLLF